MKSPSKYKRDFRPKKTLAPGSKEVGIGNAPGSVGGAKVNKQKKDFPCSRTVPWSKPLFSPSKIPQQDKVHSSKENPDICMTDSSVKEPLMRNSSLHASSLYSNRIGQHQKVLFLKY